MCNFMVARGSKNYDHCPEKVKKKKQKTEVHATQHSSRLWEMEFSKAPNHMLYILYITIF